MQKILPDVSFLAQWRDKIEAVRARSSSSSSSSSSQWCLHFCNDEAPAARPHPVATASGFCPRG
jgi:hypothetical protein